MPSGAGRRAVAVRRMNRAVAGVAAYSMMRSSGLAQSAAVRSTSGSGLEKEASPEPSTLKRTGKPYPAMCFWPSPKAG